MPEGGSIIPITDAQANAIAEASKTLRAAGGAVMRIFGTVPEDLVALLGGDRLRVRRAENILRIIAKTQERLKADKIETEPASLSIALPILEAAADESREEMQDLWARLLAAAADPKRAKSFRGAFISAIKAMDPLDAVVVAAVARRGGMVTPDVRHSLPAETQASADEVAISLDNLSKLEMLARHSVNKTQITPFGREFLRTLRG